MEFNVHSIHKNVYLLHSKTKRHKCGLHPQMWIVMGENHNKIYDHIFEMVVNCKGSLFFFQLSKA